MKNLVKLFFAIVNKQTTTVYYENNLPQTEYELFATSKRVLTRNEEIAIILKPYGCVKVWIYKPDGTTEEELIYNDEQDRVRGGRAFLSIGKGFRVKRIEEKVDKDLYATYFVELTIDKL